MKKWDKYIKERMSRLSMLRERCISEGREPSKQERMTAQGMLAEVELRQLQIDTNEEKNYFESEKSEGIMFDKVPSDLPKEGEKIMSNNSGEFRTLGDQLKDVFVAGQSGVISNRLARAATGLSEGVPSDGGFLLEPTIASGLFKSAWDTAIVAPKCWRIRVGKNSNSVKLPGFDETSRATGSRFGGVQGYWKSEAAEKTASRPKFRQIELNLNKLIGLCYATDEVLQDSEALGQLISRAFTEEIAFRVDEAVVRGSGAGQPLGILNAGSTVEVSKEVGQAAATILFENTTKMWARLLPRSQRTAVWLVHSSALPQLFSMSLSVGTGGIPVFMPAGGLSSEPYATLFGRPVIPIEQCSALGTAGDIILGDFQNGYVVADKGSVKEDISIHVRFIYDLENPCRLPEKSGNDNAFNCWEALTDNAEGNQQPSPEVGRFNDYSERKYIQADGKGAHLNSLAEGDDIVWSAWRHAAAA